MIEILNYINNDNTLSKALSYIINTNQSNHNPYHNFNHLLNTAKYALRIGKSENLTEYEIRNLIIAALFHDVNHTGNLKNSDSMNIGLAIGKFAEFYNNNLVTIFTTVDIDFILIVSLIQATEYPYIEIDLTKLHLIIRDADFSQIFENDFVHAIVLGLAKEQNVNIKKRVSDQISFTKVLVYNTEYCKLIWNELRDERIEEFSIIEKILK